MGKGKCQRKRSINREKPPSRQDSLRPQYSFKDGNSAKEDYTPTILDNDTREDQNEKLLEYQEAIEKNPENMSLTKNILTKEMAINLIGVRTDGGDGLGNCIYVNVKNPESACPYAVSADCYNVFADFFAEVIEEVHGETEDQASILPQFGKLDLLSSMDLNSFSRKRARALYTEVCVRRNIEDIPFTPTMSSDDRQNVISQIETKVRDLLVNSEEDPIIPREWDIRMDSQKNDLDECATMRNYPDDRSMFVFKDERHVYEGCILNFDDHVQFVTSTNDGRIGEVFKRMFRYLMDESMSDINYVAHPVFGHLTLSPAHVGTGMNIRVIVKLPFLTRLEDANALIKEFDCDVNHYSPGEKTGLFILTNLKTLNITEEIIFKNVVLAFNQLSRMEDELEYTTAMAVQDDSMSAEDLFNLYRMIKNNQHLTYTKKYLTESLVTQFSNDETNFKSTFNNCIRHNAYYPRSLFPRACDSNCYTKFARFFDPILLETNGVKGFNHSKKPIYGTDFNERRYKLRHPDLKSYRIRFNRNFDKFPFPMMMSFKDREDVEKIAIKCFEELPVELEGEYCAIKDIKNSIHYEDILSKKLLPDLCDVHVSAGFYRDYPDNRGIFIVNQHKNYPNIIMVVLINVVDHIKIVALDPSGRALNVCYERAVCMMKHLDLKFEKKFAKKTGYGFLTSIPSSVGCGLRISAMIRLKNLGDKRELLEQECSKNQMVYRGSNGHGTVANDNVFDISVKQNLSITEKFMLMVFVQKVKDLINVERTHNARIQKPTDDSESNASEDVNSSDGNDLTETTNKNSEHTSVKVSFKEESNDTRTKDNSSSTSR